MYDIFYDIAKKMFGNNFKTESYKCNISKERLVRMNYKIFGLATEMDYQSYNGDCPYHLAVFEEKYYLMDELPDISSIHQIITRATITNYKLNKNRYRPIVIIQGDLDFQLLYATTKADQSIHTGNFTKKILTFVEIPVNYDRYKIQSVHLLQEDLALNLIHCRKFEVSFLLFSYIQIV